jgi:hypothetical protein
MLSFSRLLLCQSSSSVGGISGMVVPTRSDYGGRPSLLTLMLPSTVLTTMLSVLWIFHSSHYGSVLILCWIVLGLCLMLSEWYRAGMIESRIQATTSYRINTLGSFVYLLVFESAFFAGTYWLMCISRIQGVSEVSYRNPTSGSDLSFAGSWESCDWNVCVNMGDVSGTTYMSTGYAMDHMSEVMLPIFFNLWILLCVSLLLQYGHRIVQMRDMA